MVLLHVLGLDLRLVDLIELFDGLLVVLPREVEPAQVVARLGHGGVHGVAVDKGLQQVAGILVVEFGSAHALVEQRVRLQVVLLVLGTFIDMLEVLLRGSVLLLVEQIHRRLVLILG